MIQTFTLCAALVAVTAQACTAQAVTVAPSPALQQIAFVDTPLPAEPLPANTESLPDAPVSTSLDAELPDAPIPTADATADQEPPSKALAGATQQSARGAQPIVAPRYSPIILPNERAQSLHGSQWLIFGLRDSFNLYQGGGILLSAGWSQLIDSRPHYGQDGDAFGKRVGVGALRSTIQAMATDSVFSPAFHEDPRYYVMGKQNGGYVKRALYAATRVFVTRTNSGGTSINGGLLAGYALAAGMNNIYYPDQDRGAKNSATEWASSLGGAALGFEAEEFLKDALNIFHRITKTEPAQ